MNVNNTINPTSIGFNILNSPPSNTYSYSRNPTSAELYEEYLRNELLKISKVQRSKPMVMGNLARFGVKLPGISNIINNIPSLSESLTKTVGGLSAITSILGDSARHLESLRTRSQSKDLGTIGKAYRGLNLFNTLAAPLSMGSYLGTALTGHLVPNLKYKALSGLGGLLGSTVGLGSAGAALAPFLYGIGSMIVAKMKNNARISLRSNKSKLFREVSQYSRSAFVMKDVNRMLMSGQITSGDALIASLLSLIEENTSVMPAMYVSTEHKHQVKEVDTHETVSAYKKELNPKTPVEALEEKNHQTLPYLFDTIEAATLRARAKYDPFFQLSNFLTRGKTPGTVMEETEGILGTEKEKKNIEQVSELTSKEVGLHIADTKLMITPSDLIMEKGETYESKSIILAAAQFDLLRVIARESSVIRKYGFGIPSDKISGKVAEISLLQANVEEYKRERDETPLDELFNMTFGGHGLFEKLPVISSLYSMISKLSELFQPKKLFEKLKERFSEFGTNLIKKIAGKYNVEDRTSTIKEILSSMGVLKSVVERRDEYLADELPNVLHEQLITQKDIYDVLSDMYKLITGNKHRSKHDEERESKWDAIAGTYLSPDQKREQQEWIELQVSNALQSQRDELTKNREGLFGIFDVAREKIADVFGNRGTITTHNSLINDIEGLKKDIEELVQNPNISETQRQKIQDRMLGQKFYLGGNEEQLAALKSLYEKQEIPKKQPNAEIEDEKPLNPYSLKHLFKLLSNKANISNRSGCDPVKICNINELASGISKANDNEPDSENEKLFKVINEHVPEMHNELSKISKHEEGQSETKNKKCLCLSDIKSFLSEKFLSGRFKELFDKGIKNFVLDIIKSDINTIKKIGLGVIESVISKIKGVKDAGLSIVGTVINAVKNIKYIGLGVVKSVIDKIKGVKDIGSGVVKSVKDIGLGVVKSVVDKIKVAKDAGLSIAKSVVDKIKGAKDAGLDMFKSGIDKIKGVKNAGLSTAKSVFDKIKGVKNAGLSTAKSVVDKIKSVKDAGLSTAKSVVDKIKSVKDAGLSGIFNMIKSNIFKSKKSDDDSQEDNVSKEISEIDERNLKMKQVKAYDTIIKYLPDIYDVLSNKSVKREGDQSDNKKDKDGGSSFLSDMAGNIGSLLLERFLFSRFKWLRNLPGKKLLQGLFNKGTSVLKWVGKLFSKGAGLSAAEGAAEGIGLGATKGAETAINAVKSAEGATEGAGLGATKGAETAINAVKNAEGATEGAGLGATKGAETAINAVKSAEGATEGAGLGAAEGAGTGAAEGAGTGVAEGAASLAKVAKGVKVGGGLLAAGLGLYTAYDAYKKGGIKAAAKDVSGTIGSVGGSVAGAAIGQTLIPVPILGAVVGSMVGGYLGNKLGKEVGGDVISAIDDHMSDQTKKIDEIQKNVTQNDETQDENKKLKPGANETDIAKIFDKTDPDSPLNKFLTATEALLAASQAIINGSTIMAKSASIQPPQIPAVVPSAPSTQQPSKGLDSMIYNLFETDNVNGLRNGLIKFGLGEQHAYA